MFLFQKETFLNELSLKVPRDASAAFARQFVLSCCGYFTIMSISFYEDIKYPFIMVVIRLIRISNGPF